MKRLVRSFLFLGVLVAAMVLGQLVAEAAVTVLLKAKCKDSPNCTECLYRIEGHDGCASRRICRAHKCDTFPLTIRVCIYSASGGTCTGNQGITQGCTAGCMFWNCGCVVGAECAGNCSCTGAGGNPGAAVTGWLVC